MPKMVLTLEGHTRERVWSKGSHFLLLEVRILQPKQVAKLWSQVI